MGGVGWGIICDRLASHPGTVAVVLAASCSLSPFRFLLQYFVLTSKGELKSEDNCLDYNGYDLYLRECDGVQQNQKWEYKVRL